MTGGAYNMTGNGFLSNFLPGPLGKMAEMVGMGKRKRNVRRKRRVQSGRGKYGELIAETINKFTNSGMNDLSRVLIDKL